MNTTDFRGQDHAQADWPGRDLPEREEPAPEQGAGHADLKSRLLEREMRERAEQEGALRQAQVGTGDRSAKVRTYNFPQGRIPTIVSASPPTTSRPPSAATSKSSPRPLAKERADKLAAEAAGTPG